jgi:NADH dehydrogenase FAD-containing subunit
MQKLTDRKKTLKRNKPYKKALRQQEAELDSRIRQTFEQASQALRETLAQTALLRTMIAGSGHTHPLYHQNESPNPP